MKTKIMLKVLWEAIKRSIAMVRQDYYYWEEFEKTVKKQTKNNKGA